MRLVHLQIGQCIVTRNELMISTVLGSCVSATFFHRKTGFAGIFHAMLPQYPQGGDTMGSCKYVDFSIAQIHARAAKLGIAPRSVEVKLFGGGFTINSERKHTVRDIVDVGKKNVEMAEKVLKQHRYVVSSEDVLGEHGRKLYFHTGTGEVWLRKLIPSEREHILV